MYILLFLKKSDESTHGCGLCRQAGLPLSKIPLGISTRTSPPRMKPKFFLQFRLRSRRPSEYSRLRHSLQSCESLVRALQSHETGHRFF